MIVATCDTKLEIGKLYEPYAFSDLHGVDHRNMAVRILREATQEEYIQNIIAEGGFVRHHGPYYYLVSTD